MTLGCLRRFATLAASLAVCAGVYLQTRARPPDRFASSEPMPAGKCPPRFVRDGLGLLRVHNQSAHTIAVQVDAGPLIYIKPDAYGASSIPSTYYTLAGCDRGAPETRQGSPCIIDTIECGEKPRD